MVHAPGNVSLLRLILGMHQDRSQFVLRFEGHTDTVRDEDASQFLREAAHVR